MGQTPEDDGCFSRHFSSSSRILGALAAPEGLSASPCTRGCVSHTAFPGKELHVSMLLENVTTSPRAAGTGSGFVSIQHSQAEPGSVLQLQPRFVPCVRDTELRDLQEVANLARIRWGPCTRARALPHLSRVTQSGSESWHGETPGAWRGWGQLLVLSKDLLCTNSP